MTLGITKELLAGDTADAALVLAKVSSISQPLRVMQKQADPSAWEAIKNFATDAWSRDDVRSTLAGAGVGAGVGALSSMFRSGKDKSNFLNSIITGGLAGGGIGYGLHSLYNSDIFGEDGFSLGESEKEETARRLIDKVENKDQVWPLGGTFTGIANLVPSDEPGVRDWSETIPHALVNAIPIAGLGIIPEEIYTGAQEVRKKLQLRNIKAGKPGPIDLPAFRKELAEWAAGKSNTAQLAGNAQEARNVIHKMSDADLTKLLEGINEGKSYHVDHLGAVNKGVAPTVQPVNAARIDDLYKQIDVLEKSRRPAAFASANAKIDVTINKINKQIEKLQNIKSPTPHLGVVNLPWRGDVLDARLTRVPWWRRGSKTLRTVKGVGGAVAATVPALLGHWLVNNYGMSPEDEINAKALEQKYPVTEE